MVCREIRAKRPRMLFGYPSALTHIARHARDASPMDGLGIKVAFVTSERLYDDQREKIGRAFGCRVANGYGGRDAGFIAHECPAGGMHSPRRTSSSRSSVRPVTSCRLVKRAKSS